MAKRKSYPDISSFAWIDPATDLMWMLYPSGEDLTWSEAMALPARVNADEARHFDDWRVPTIDELKTLVLQDSQGRTTFRTDVFHDMCDSFAEGEWMELTFWSSSLEDGSVRAWCLDFFHNASANDSKRRRHRVRLVREAPADEQIAADKRACAAREKIRKKLEREKNARPTLSTAWIDETIIHCRRIRRVARKRLALLHQKATTRFGYTDDIRERIESLPEGPSKDDAVRAERRLRVIEEALSRPSGHHCHWSRSRAHDPTRLPGRERRKSRRRRGLYNGPLYQPRRRDDTVMRLGFSDRRRRKRRWLAEWRRNDAKTGLFSWRDGCAERLSEEQRLLHFAALRGYWRTCYDGTSTVPCVSEARVALVRLAARFNNDIVKLATGRTNNQISYGPPEEVFGHSPQHGPPPRTGGVTLERVFRDGPDRSHFFEVALHSSRSDRRCFRFTLPIDLDFETHSFAIPKPRPDGVPVSPDHDAIREVLTQGAPADCRKPGPKQDAFFHTQFTRTIPTICRTLPGGGSIMRPDSAPWREGGSQILRWNPAETNWDYRPGVCFHELDLDLGVVTVQLALRVQMRLFPVPIRSLFPEFRDLAHDFSRTPATMINSLTGCPPVCPSCRKSFMVPDCSSQTYRFSGRDIVALNHERCLCPSCQHTLTLKAQDAHNHNLWLEARDSLRLHKAQ